MTENVVSFPTGAWSKDEKWITEKEWSVSFRQGTPVEVLTDFVQGQLEGVCQKHFKIGDAYNWMMENSPEEVFQLFDRVDYEEGTIRNDGWIASRIPPAERGGGIKYWSHFQEIASIKDPEERNHVMSLAAEGEITGQDIREYKAGEGGGETIAGVRCPTCGVGHVPEELEPLIRKALSAGNVSTVT